MDIDKTQVNPIDVVEDVIYEKKWSFSRSEDNELVAEISSNWCEYRLYFSWSENIRAMSFTITFDLSFPQVKLIKAYELLALINEKLWLGHFDITNKNGIPAYRHTILESDNIDFLHKKLENLVDIGIYECEKYYPAFQQVLFDELVPIEAIKFSDFDIIGRA
tara:strand:+ start:10253 stop:10741 length:489 start_codon:yes stop_codon:yes gene_type:complete